MSISALLAVFLFVPAGELQEDRTGALAQEISESQRANLERLQDWSWTSRVSVAVGNGPTNVREFHVRFVEGRIQRTPIDAASTEKKQGRKARGKEQQQLEWFDHVAETVLSYTNATHGQLLDFFDGATFAPDADGESMRIDGGGFLQEDDTVVLWLDLESMLIRRMEFRTRVDGETLQGLVNYGRLADGTNYASKATIQVPATQMNAAVENADPVRLTP